MNIVEPLKGNCCSCANNCAHRSTNYIRSFCRISMYVRKIHKAKILVLFNYRPLNSDYFEILCDLCGIAKNNRVQMIF
jgi:hypothetical protein